MASNDEKQPIIIIKKVKKGGDGHHGGAWKVAYADFVTAMMAFFLLLWLLSVTTDEQKAMISSYFAPTDARVSQSTSGAGGVMGGLSMTPDGAMINDESHISSPDVPSGSGQEGDMTQEELEQVEEERLLAEVDRRDEAAFEATQEKIKQAIDSFDELKSLSNNILMDMTPEGLRIQIVDQEGKPMFELGSAKPLPAAEKLLRLITQAIEDLPNHISIRGHTDATKYGKNASYTNWELSSDRSNTSRRLMLESGLDLVRVENVQGKADRELLVPNDPESARNRRISIILLKQSIVPVSKEAKENAKKRKQIKEQRKRNAPRTRKREEGVIYFP